MPYLQSDEEREVLRLYEYLDSDAKYRVVNVILGHDPDEEEARR